MDKNIKGKQSKKIDVENFEKRFNQYIKICVEGYAKNAKKIDNKINTYEKCYDSLDVLEELSEDMSNYINYEYEIHEENIEQIFTDEVFYKIVKSFKLKEKKILFYIFLRGYSIGCTAALLGKSKSGVHYSKQKILSKIRKEYLKRGGHSCGE